MDVNLIRYLPPDVAGIKEIKAIIAGQEPELKKLWDAVNQACSEQFLQTMGIFGIERWEGMLGIVPPPSASIEKRRAAIIARLLGGLPYTMRKLIAVLDQFCGRDNYRLDMEKGSYTLHIEFVELTDDITDPAVDMILRMVPANILLDLKTSFARELHQTLYTGTAYEPHKTSVILNHSKLSRQSGSTLYTGAAFESFKTIVIADYTAFSHKHSNTAYSGTAHCGFKKTALSDHTISVQKFSTAVYGGVGAEIYKSTVLK